MIKYKDQEFKVVICTPAGREKYLSVFKKSIYKKMEEGLIDGWQLWYNTIDAGDTAYLLSMEAENPKVKIYRIGDAIDSTEDGVSGLYETFNPLKTHKFFANAQDDDTIYIRFDDDIIWIEDGAIEKMCQARIDNPDAFIIYPNIINSTTCTAWHQEKGVLSEEAGVVRKYDKTDPDYSYLHEFNYTDNRLINHIHNTFRKNYEEKTLYKYYLPSRSLVNFERFSICSICWFGKDKIKLGYIEEPQLSWELPMALGKPNFFCGDALLVHLSYHTQRPLLEAQGDIHLKYYAKISTENYG